MHKTLWASKVARIPILRILGLPIWESLDKMTLGMWPITNNTIRGKVVASPKLGPW